MEADDSRWRIPSIYWIPFLLFICTLFMVDVFQIRYYIVPSTKLLLSSSPDDYLLSEQNSLDGFLIKTKGCRIPYMDPYDRSVAKFIKEMHLDKCNNGVPALMDSNLTSIFIRLSAVPAYNITDLDRLNCCYTAFWRKEPDGSSSDNKVTFNDTCRKFTKSVNIMDEFVKVTCRYDDKKDTIYTDFFSFVPNKIDNTNNNNIIHKNFNDNNPPVSDKINVLVIGLDAVSRINFHRQMPKTVEYLKNISGIELLGYNKVGDNTYPNLVPVLTGYSENELEELCWKDHDHFDKCPFIWKDYKQQGYLTSFAEDASWMGVFNYAKKGFRKQPTDYMWGPFNRISEQTIGNNHNMNVDECVGARAVYQVFLDYILKFVIRMSVDELPYFSFNWGASLTHDYLNKPSLGDDNYYEFFESLKSNNYLDNTVMVVMSDHGIRWGDIRQTYQGRMEERLPFVFLVLPDWFKTKYRTAYNNLLNNVRRLSTPYDLHETLKDFLNISSLTSINNRDFMEERTGIDNNTIMNRRGISLFKKISLNRTCDDAGIASHWCTCQQSTAVSVDDAVVRKAAKFAVDYINRKLDGYADCANLTLKSISNARMMSHGDHILKGHKTQDYMITLKTTPGDGIFEVTVRSTPAEQTYHFGIMGTISRLNLYGKQSACITDFHLKLYCYCKGLI